MIKKMQTKEKVMKMTSAKMFEYFVAKNGVSQSTTYRFSAEAKATSKNTSMKRRIGPFQNR